MNTESARNVKEFVQVLKNDDEDQPYLFLVFAAIETQNETLYWCDDQANAEQSPAKSGQICRRE